MAKTCITPGCGRQFLADEAGVRILCHKCGKEHAKQGHCHLCGGICSEGTTCTACGQVIDDMLRNQEKKSYQDFRTYRTADHKENTRETKKGSWHG